MKRLRPLTASRRAVPGALAAAWVSSAFVVSAWAQQPAPPPPPPPPPPEPAPAGPPPAVPPAPQYPPQQYPPQQYPPQQYPPQQYPPQQYPPAYTEPPPPRLRERRGIHEHDGFYLRIGLGFAPAASHRLSTDRSKSFGQKWTAGGGGAAMEFAMGGTVGGGVVIGGGVYGTTSAAPTFEAKTSAGTLEETGRDFTVSGIGPFVDWYFDPKAGGHVQLAVTVGGVAAEGLPPGLVESSDPDVESDERIQGSMVAFVLGGGYEFWIGEQWSLGPLARFQYSEGTIVETADRAEVETIDVTGYSFSLLASLTFH